METKRIVIVDEIKGFAILLVVIGHIISGFYKESYLESPVLNIIVAFWMPLFVFLSGFVGYKTDYGNFDVFFKKKVPALLFPCIFMGTLYALWKTIPIEILFFSNLKYGYWFTLVLLEIFFLFYFVNQFILLVKVKTNIYIDLLIYLLPYSFLIVLFFLLDAKMIDLVSLKELIRLYIYFVLGALMRKYSTVFESIISKNIFYSICLFFFFTALPFIDYQNVKSTKEFVEDLLLRVPVALSAIGIIWYLFKYFSPSVSVVHLLSRLGQRTLDIYLLHFFFLPDVSFLVKPFMGKENLIFEITFSVMLAIPIILLCLLISKLIRISKIGSFLLLGIRI